MKVSVYCITFIMAFFTTELLAHQSGAKVIPVEGRADMTKIDSKMTASQRLFTWPSETEQGIVKVLIDGNSLPDDEIEVAEVYFPPGWVGESHVHELEILYVVEGDLGHATNAKTQTLLPGMMVITKSPEKVIHSSKNGAKVLVIWPKGNEVVGLEAELDEVEKH